MELYEDHFVLKHLPDQKEHKYSGVEYIKRLSFFPYLRKGGMEIVLKDQKSLNFWTKSVEELINQFKKLGVLIK